MKFLKRVLVLSLALAVILTGVLLAEIKTAFAEGDEEDTTEVLAEKAKYVTIYDQGEKLIVKTEAKTVEEALARVGTVINEGDKIEPGVKDEIEGDNFFINIYRARPVVVLDGVKKKFLMTASMDAREIAREAGLALLEEDEIEMVLSEQFLEVGAVNCYQITRAERPEEEVEEIEEEVFDPGSVRVGRPLTARMGRNRYLVTTSDGRTIERQETYYDLNMWRVIKFCGSSYSVREDGVKVDQDGYVLVAANLARYPRCSVVETSLGLGKVYDTGGFAASNPEQFDIATDWSRNDGI